MITLKRPTEKTELMRLQRKYYFDISDLNKIEVSALVSKNFLVKVDSVNIIVQKPKKSRRGKMNIMRRSRSRIAIVTLAQGHSISLPTLDKAPQEEQSDAQ